MANVMNKILRNLDMVDSWPSCVHNAAGHFHVDFFFHFKSHTHHLSLSLSPPGKLAKITLDSLNANMKCDCVHAFIMAFNLLANMFEYWFTMSLLCQYSWIKMTWNYYIHMNEICFLIANMNAIFIFHEGKW